METEIKTIKTGVDKLVELIKDKKRVTVDEAAKLLSMPKELVEELADFLEEREVIGIEYKFAVPHLVFKELTREQTEERAKQFAGRRVGFVRKVDVTLQNLDQHSESLLKLKEEFLKLNKELDTKVIHAKGELDLLSRYEQMKRDIDNQILEQQKEFMGNKRTIDAQIELKKKAITNLVSQISTEEKKLTKEESLDKLLRANEEQLEMMLKAAAKRAELIEEKLKSGRSVVDEAIERIINYKQLAAVAKQDMQAQAETLAPLLEESRQHERKIVELRKSFMQKVSAEAKVVNKASQNEPEKILSKFKALFQKKANAENIVYQLTSDLDGIKKDLRALVQEAMVIQLTSKSKNVAEVVKDFEGKFRTLSQKKEKFQKEVYKLMNQLQKF